jgi:uncharacterized membrane protein YdjX (TVP38/TMEM64 family)
MKRRQLRKKGVHSMTNSRKVLRLIQLSGLVAIILFGITCYRLGYLTDPASLQATILQAGVWAPLLFILLQIIQVIFSVIPGGLSTVAAIAMFGAKWGFVYNYIGISIGSIASFLLVRRFGRGFISLLVPERTMAKYQHYLNGGKNFDRVFAIAILMPVAPDDLLCMFAGLTKMSVKKFVLIIVFGKPWTILAYSLGLNTAFKFIAPYL